MFTNFKIQSLIVLFANPLFPEFPFLKHNERSADLYAAGF